MKEISSYLLFFIFGTVLLHGSTCNQPPNGPLIDNNCQQSLEHMKQLGCSPKGKWLAACETHKKNNSGMFDLHCINVADAGNILINECKVACEPKDGGIQ